MIRTLGAEGMVIPSQYDEILPYDVPNVDLGYGADIFESSHLTPAQQIALQPSLDNAGHVVPGISSDFVSALLQKLTGVVAPVSQKPIAAPTSSSSFAGKAASFFTANKDVLYLLAGVFVVVMLLNNQNGGRRR